MDSPICMNPGVAPPGRGESTICKNPIMSTLPRPCVFKTFTQAADASPTSERAEYRWSWKAMLPARKLACASERHCRIAATSLLSFCAVIASKQASGESNFARGAFFEGGCPQAPANRMARSNTTINTARAGNWIMVGASLLTPLRSGPLLLHRRDHLLRRVGQIIGSRQLHAALAEDLFAFFDLGPFEANDQRHVEADCFAGSDDGAGDRRAAGNAAE